MQPIEKLENCGQNNCLTFMHFGEEGEKNFMELQIRLDQEIDLALAINTPQPGLPCVWAHPSSSFDNLGPFFTTIFKCACVAKGLKDQKLGSNSPRKVMLSQR